MQELSLEQPEDRSRKAHPLVEILAVFAVALLWILLGVPFAGEDPIQIQTVVWLANISMLLTVWLGLRRRGQTFEDLGLSLRFSDRRALLSTVLRSIPVFFAAVIAFVVAAILMANLIGMPEKADMSQYNALSGNLPLLLIALAAVFLGSSIAEEVLYRGFLMHRVAELWGGGHRAWQIAVVVSSVIFGFIHYEWGPAGIVQTSFMGFALALSFLKFGRRLWIVILAHAYMDFILMVQMYLA